MKATDELPFEYGYRPLSEINAAYAEKDMKIQALTAQAKESADGYKAQLKALAVDLNRLRAEYRAASIAAEGGR